MKKLASIGLLIIVGILISCGTTSSTGSKEKNIYQRGYFFRPGAEYYSYIDLESFRPLIRALTKTLPSSQRMQVQMVSERTSRIYSYRVEDGLYSLLEGSYPKGIMDSLLTRHPEWLDLPSDVDGYRHYSASLEIGLPVSNVIYATTGSLEQAYTLAPTPQEDFLPPHVIMELERRPFVIYYPVGNLAFQKDNPKFASLPRFELLLTMFPQDVKSYRLHAEFTLASNTQAVHFMPELQGLIDWYKSYYTQWADLLQIIDLDVQGNQVILSATYTEEDIVRLSSDAIKITITKLMQGDYTDEAFTSRPSLQK